MAGRFPSQVAVWLSWGAAGFSSQPASTLLAAFFKAVPLLEMVPGSRVSS